MSCKWGNEDCKFLDSKCHLCATENYYYITSAKKVNKIQKRAAKVTKRMGANFEYENNKNNNLILTDVASRMTPNSGAGKVKGDEQINSFVKITEELKTSVKTNSRGEKQFTIQKEWLDKLKRESMAENRDFWYLKFAFGDNEIDWYAIVESDTIMGMVKTMVEDRKKSSLCDAKIKVFENRANLKDAENVKLFAENELLKSEIELLKKELELKNKCID